MVSDWQAGFHLETRDRAARVVTAESTFRGE